MLKFFYELFGKKKQDKEKCMLLLVLPTEVKLHLFSYLSVTDLCESACVCKEFKALAMDDSLWKRFFVKLHSTKDPPPSRVCHSALVYGDRMYIYGGHVPDALNYIRDVKNDFYSYQFSTKRWEVVTPKNEALPYKTEHTAVLHKHCMYLFGGYSGSLGYRDTSIYEYNFETRQCSRVEATGTVPPDRSAHTAVVYKERMYVMGGWDGSDSNNDFYAFDFATKKWEEVPYFGETAPPRVRSHCAAVYGDYMVIFGGFGENTHPVSIYTFHFPTMRWREICPTSASGKRDSQTFGPCGRSRFRMVYHQDSHSLWAFGGWDRKSYFADLWRFRLDTMSWHKIDAAFDLKGVGQHSLVVYQGQMYLYGGYSADSKAPHPHLYVYRFPKKQRKLSCVEA